MDWHLPKDLSKYRVYVIASIIYLLITLVNFYPATLSMASTVPGNGGDTYDGLWSMWWFDHALFSLHTNPYYTTLMFWPLGVNLAYQNLAPLAALFAAPFQLVSLAFAYNMTVFLGFVLSGLFMFILADHLVKNKYAAFIAGLAFTFSSFHLLHSYQLDFTNIEWVPLFLFFFIKFAEKEGDNRYNIAGMAVCLSFSVLFANVEVGVMLLMLLFLLICSYVFEKEWRKAHLNRDFAVGIIAAGVLAFIVGSWNFIPMIQAVLQPGGLLEANLQNNIEFNVHWSNDILGFFVPIYTNIAYNSIDPSGAVFKAIYAPGAGERAAYIGYAALFFAAVGINRYRKKAVSWAVIGVIFAVLALGPQIYIAGAKLPIPGIVYQAYSQIPFLNVIREPARFDMVVALCVSILVAYGIKAFVEDRHKYTDLIHRNRHYIVAVIAVAILLENLTIPIGSPSVNASFTQLKIPGFYKLLTDSGSNFSILPLPAFASFESRNSSYFIAQQMLYASMSGIPIVGGWTTRENYTDDLLLYDTPITIQVESMQAIGGLAYQSQISQNYANQTLFSMYLYHTYYVILSKHYLTNFTQLADVETYLAEIFGYPTYQDKNFTVYGTQDALRRSFLQSYVGIPVPPSLNATLAPTGLPPQIIVYAPLYGNSTVDRTNMSFDITSNYPFKLYIRGESPRSPPSTLGVVNVTAGTYIYHTYVNLSSGLDWNRIAFVPGVQGANFTITGISFTRG